MVEVAAVPATGVEAQRGQTRAGKSGQQTEARRFAGAVEGPAQDLDGLLVPSQEVEDGGHPAGAVEEADGRAVDVPQRRGGEPVGPRGVDGVARGVQGVQDARRAVGQVGSAALPRSVGIVGEEPVLPVGVAQEVSAATSPARFSSQSLPTAPGPGGAGAVVPAIAAMAAAASWA